MVNLASSRAPFAAALLLALTGRAVAAPAEGEEDPRAVEARKACASGQVDKGIKLLSDYLASTNDTTAIFNMGRCYQQNGIADKAVAQFREYLERAPDLTLADRREVQGYIADLEAKQRIAPPTVAPPAPEREPRVALRTAGLALGGVGVVAIGAGLVFGLNVRSANADLHDGKRTPDWTTYDRRQHDGEHAETLQWISLGIGAAALAAGTVCYLLALPRPNETAVAPWAVPGGGGLALAHRY
jgi:hypothetical protein